MAAAGEEITTLEVIGQMEAIPAQVTVAICSIFSTSVTMDPVRGTVQRGWQIYANMGPINFNP